MRVYNPKSDGFLMLQIQSLLTKYRTQRNFNPTSYLKAKSILLNNYMNQCNLKACVVGLSGGIDSAVTLGIIKYAMKQKNSPIEKIVPLLLPAFDNIGATGQDTATQRGVEICKTLHLHPYLINLNEGHNKLKTLTESTIDISGQAWAQGQLVAHTRTPLLYYTATLLAQENLPAIICGTTNRDEGLYLGYFGKASDGLVDIQLISDLHKYDVYQLAKALHLPESVLNVPPTGDMYDSRLDEEVFGAPYDFVEYYMYYLTLSKIEQEKIFNHFDKNNKEQFSFLQNNLENMHRYNRHKYFGASPAVHFDIDSLNVPEGWKTNCTFNKPQEKIVNSSVFVNLKNPQHLPSFFYKPVETYILEHCVNENMIYQIKNLLTQNECQWILHELSDEDWAIVGKYGKKENFNPNIDSHGSLRKSWYLKDLATLLYARLAPLIPRILPNYETTRIHGNHEIWSFTGVNPLLRFIRYFENHFLVAHYDDTYEFHSFKKTLQSLIIYLENSNSQTRFLDDPQKNLPEKLRHYDDWETVGDSKLVLKSFKSVAGEALIFDHRILHDAIQDNTSKNTQRKTILRTDLIYEAPFLGFNK